VIPPWLRVTIILAVLTVWVIYVLASLLHGTELDPLVWGVPGGFFLMLGPSLRGRGDGEGPH
jgi:hypothetical protein